MGGNCIIDFGNSIYWFYFGLFICLFFSIVFFTLKSPRAVPLTRCLLVLFRLDLTEMALSRCFLNLICISVVDTVTLRPGSYSRNAIARVRARIRV